MNLAVRTDGKEGVNRYAFAQSEKNRTREREQLSMKRSMSFRCGNFDPPKRDQHGSAFWVKNGAAWAVPQRLLLLAKAQSTACQHSIDAMIRTTLRTKAALEFRFRTGLDCFWAFLKSSS